MSESAITDKYRAPALDKGLDILELLALSDISLSQAEIAKSLDRSPNEIYRMLDRLVRRSYVSRTLDDRYELTLKLFELAHQKPPIQRLVSQALPVMRQIALDCDQAVHLVIRDRNVLVVVAQVDAPTYWNISIRVGTRMGLINTGSGHVFLAFASSEDQKLMLEEEQVTPPKALAKRLETVREAGFENLPSLQIANVANLSVPIFGPLGTVIAVLTCPFSERLDRPNASSQTQTLDVLRKAAQNISQRSTKD